MERISARDFLSAVRTAAPAPETARERGLARQARVTAVRAECSAGGAGLLLCVARIDAAIHGFPDRLSLASPDGRGMGLEAVRSGGAWRFGGTTDALLGLKHALPPHRVEGVRHFALAAMGAPTSPCADAILARVAGWDGDLGVVLDASLARLPEHVVRSVAAHAGYVLRDLGLHWDRHPEVVAAAWRRCGLFPDAPPEALHGVADPLTRAAENFRADVAAALLNPALVAPGSRLPDPSIEGRAALEVALRGTFLDARDTVRALADAGTPLGPDARGRTALHALAVAADLRQSRQTAPLADLLIVLGVDPVVADDDGKTAADLYAERDGRLAPVTQDELLMALAPEKKATLSRQP